MINLAKLSEGQMRMLRSNLPSGSELVSVNKDPSDDHRAIVTYKWYGVVQTSKFKFNNIANIEKRDRLTELEETIADCFNFISGNDITQGQKIKFLHKLQRVLGNQPNTRISPAIIDELIIFTKRAADMGSLSAINLLKELDK